MPNSTIDRRTFSLGLATLGTMGVLYPSLVLADDAMPGKKKKKKPPKDIPDTPLEQIPNHRQFMRDIVIELSRYAKGRRADFSVFARNAPELLMKEKREWDWQTARDPDGAAEEKYTPIGTVDAPYLNALDGLLFDGLFYGHDTSDQPTDPDDAQPLLAEARAAKHQSRRIFTIEYCRSAKTRADALKQAAQIPATVFIDADPAKGLDAIPGTPILENSAHIDGLSAVKNFLPLFENRDFSSHDSWVSALGATNYDLLVLNAFWRNNSALTKEEIVALKFKRLGVNRLIFAVLPIGRADMGSHYWNWDWRVGAPKWLDAPDPAVPDRYTVQYWDPAWKEIIGKYLAGLIDLGFDGVVFDSLDSYLHFEELMPL